MLGLRVKVRYFTTLHELAGVPEEEMSVEDGTTLADLIERIVIEYGEEAQSYLYHKEKTIDPSIHLLINGKDSKTLLGVKTELRDGDVVAIIPPIGGG